MLPHATVALIQAMDTALPSETPRGSAGSSAACTAGRTKPPLSRWGTATWRRPGAGEEKSMRRHCNTQEKPAASSPESSVQSMVSGHPKNTVWVIVPLSGSCNAWHSEVQTSVTPLHLRASRWMRPCKHRGMLDFLHCAFSVLL